MTVATRLVCASILLAAACVPGVAATAGTRAFAPSRARTPAPSATAILLQLQKTIDRLAVSDEAAPEDVTSLARVLTLARGRTIPASALATLAASFASAVAQGSFDEESIERLAQNLYAAVSGRDLTSREGGLVILDISGLLEMAGAERLEVDAVVRALRAICPSGADSIDGVSAHTSSLAILPRRSFSPLR